MDLLNEILLYRYAYYVKYNPLIEDWQYDMLERHYTETTGSLLKPGSDRAEDYPKAVKKEYNRRTT